VGAAKTICGIVLVMSISGAAPAWAAANAGAQKAGAESVSSVWVVDPLVKVFRDAEPRDQHHASADAARGETATFQIVVRGPVNESAGDKPSIVRCEVSPLSAGGDSIGPAQVRYVGYVPVDRSVGKPAHDRLRKPPADFPDPLLEQPEISVKSGDAQPIWITLKVPLDTAPGAYHGKARVSIQGEPNAIEVPLALNVYAAKVVKTRLWVTNWFQRDTGYNPQPQRNTPEFWQMLRLYARDMAAHRQTVARTVPLELAQFSFDAKGNLTGIDWSRMDRWIQIFIDEGVIGRIEGQQFGWRKGKWDSSYVLSIYQLKDGKPEEVKVDLTSPEVERFYSKFLPSLQQHLIDKGWLDIWMQHLADEPDKERVADYRKISDLVKKYAPRLRRIDAVLTPDVASSVDVMVPLLSGLDQHFDLYKQRQKSGQELWFYTCVQPQGDYANRFTVLPLMKVRLLPWINFRYGISGYLHWGYNFWNRDKDYDEQIKLIYGTGRKDVVPGDGWVVYPKRDGLGVIDSIRWEAQRDGCEDHELLSQLAERDPAAARALVERQVIGFDKYNTDISAFRTTRRELLKQLSR
jgi:hypothetical protein